MTYRLSCYPVVVALSVAFIDHLDVLSTLDIPLGHKKTLIRAP